MVLEGEVFGFQEARSALAVAWRAAGIGIPGWAREEQGREALWRADLGSRLRPE